MVIRTTRRLLFVAAIVAAYILLYELAFLLYKSPSIRGAKVVEAILAEPKQALTKPIRSLIDGTKRWVQLISAFYDDRAGLGKQACVRVIIIRDIKVTPRKCLLFSKGKLIQAKKAWLQRIGIGMQYKEFYFREEVVSCCVSHTMRPDFVSLTYFSGPINASYFDVLRVQYPLKPKTAPRTIINCVSATFGDMDPKRIVEWLELQRLLGMDKVEIHDINMSRRMRRVFDAYSKGAGDGLVEVLDFATVLAPDNYNLLYMSPAINNCLYRNMYLYKAVAVFDLDEVIYPRKHGTYGELLGYLRNLPSNKSLKYSHFTFHNVPFYLNINVSRPKTWTSTFTRYIHHLEPRIVNDLRMKSIINPAGCFAMHNHHCWGDVHNKTRDNSDMLITDTHHEYGDVKIAANQHYKSCINCGDDITKFFEDRSMLKLKDRLDPIILKKFEALGLKN